MKYILFFSVYRDAVFWWNCKDGAEEHATSIIKMCLSAIYWTTVHHITEDSNLHEHRSVCSPTRNVAAFALQKNAMAVHCAVTDETSSLWLYCAVLLSRLSQEGTLKKKDKPRPVKSKRSIRKEVNPTGCRIKEYVRGI